MERYIVITQAYYLMEYNNGGVVYANRAVDENGDDFNEYYNNMYFQDKLSNALTAYRLSKDIDGVEQFSYILVI